MNGLVPRRHCEAERDPEIEARIQSYEMAFRLQSSAPELKDLKKEGEFGRTPVVETNPALGRSLGRDHHPQAFTVWLAGGGIKSGIKIGATDELGFNVVEKPVEVFDLQATILHCLGLDHERLTYRYAGRDFRLTDIHGHVLSEILA